MWHGFEIDGGRFGVRSTSHEFGEWVRFALDAYRLPDGEWDPEEIGYLSVVVGDDVDLDRGSRKRFSILYNGSAAVVRSLSVNTIAKALLSDIESVRHGVRADHLYLSAGLASIEGLNVLLPALFTSTLNCTGRRLEHSAVQLTATATVAVDLSTARAVPIPRTLELPSGALERLEGIFMPDDVPDRLEVREPTEVHAILVAAREHGVSLQPMSRARTLQRLGASTYNLRTLGGPAIDALGRLIAGAGCFEQTWGRAQQVLSAVEAVPALVRTGYAARGTEDTFAS